VGAHFVVLGTHGHVNGLAGAASAAAAIYLLAVTPATATTHNHAHTVLCVTVCMRLVAKLSMR